MVLVEGRILLIFPSAIGVVSLGDLYFAHRNAQLGKRRGPEYLAAGVGLIKSKPGRRRCGQQYIVKNPKMGRCWSHKDECLGQRRGEWEGYSPSAYISEKAICSFIHICSYAVEKGDMAWKWICGIRGKEGLVGT